MDISATSNNKDPGNDDEFDDLVRIHLKNICLDKTRHKYRGLGAEPSAEPERHIPSTSSGRRVPHAVVWTFTEQVARIQRGGRLTILTDCPGVLTLRAEPQGEAWCVDGGEPRTPDTSAPLSTRMVPAGGVMAGVRLYHLTLGPFLPEMREVRFTFRCTHPGCNGRDILVYIQRFVSQSGVRL
jgi:hypothetical protein